MNIYQIIGILIIIVIMYILLDTNLRSNKTIAICHKQLGDKDDKINELITKLDECANLSKQLRDINNEYKAELDKIKGYNYSNYASFSSIINHFSLPSQKLLILKISQWLEVQDYKIYGYYYDKLFVDNEGYTSTKTDRVKYYSNKENLPQFISVIEELENSKNTSIFTLIINKDI